MANAPRRKTDEIAGSMWPVRVQAGILCAVAFASPLVAGRLTPIPALSIQAAVMLATLAWIIRSAREGHIALPGKPVVACSGIFFALLVFSAWRSASPYLTIRELLNTGSYLLIFLMVAGSGSNQRMVHAVLASAIVSALVVGALGIREYALAGDGGWRVFSTFFNPDFLAGFAGMMLPVALAWYLSRTSPVVSLVTGLCAVGLFANVLLSGSRFGALAAIGGVSVFLVLALISKSLRKPQVIRALILLIPLVLVYRALNTPLAARVSATKAESHSGGFRIHTWRGTLRMAEANPIHGMGLGTFEVAYPRYASVGFTKLAHNSYLQIAAEAGPLSCAALLLLLGVAALPPMIALARGRVNSESDAGAFPWMPDRALMTSGLLGGAATSIARNMADSDWYVTAIGIGFWAILGAAVALGGLGQLRSVTFSRRSGQAAAGVLCAALVWTLLSLGGEACMALGDREWTADPQATIGRYALANRLDPLNAEHHRKLASACRSLAFHSSSEFWAQRASDELAAAILLEPRNAKSYYMLGRMSEFYPSFENAIRAYETALKLDPNSPRVMLALARAQGAVGRKADALRTWQRMTDLERTPYERVRAVPELVQPEYIFAHFALGREAERRGDLARAQREYVQALERVDRYEESVKAMKPMLEANNRRDPATEDEVSWVGSEMTARLKALGLSR